MPFDGDVFDIKDIYKSTQMFYLYLYSFNGFILNFDE